MDFLANTQDRIRKRELRLQLYLRTSWLEEKALSPAGVNAEPKQPDKVGSLATHVIRGAPAAIETLHSRMESSSAPEATRFLAVARATECTQSVWPVKVLLQLPDSASHCCGEGRNRGPESRGQMKG